MPKKFGLKVLNWGPEARQWYSLRDSAYDVWGGESGGNVWVYLHRLWALSSLQSRPGTPGSGSTSRRPPSGTPRLGSHRQACGIKPPASPGFCKSAFLAVQAVLAVPSLPWVFCALFRKSRFVAESGKNKVSATTQQITGLKTDVNHEKDIQRQQGRAMLSQVVMRCLKA